MTLVLLAPPLVISKEDGQHGGACLLDATHAAPHFRTPHCACASGARRQVDMVQRYSVEYVYLYDLCVPAGMMGHGCLVLDWLSHHHHANAAMATHLFTLARSE